jgi:hypothetical protein
LRGPALPAWLNILKRGLASTAGTTFAGKSARRPRLPLAGIAIEREEAGQIAGIGDDSPGLAR